MSLSHGGISIVGRYRGAAQPIEDGNHDASLRHRVERFAGPTLGLLIVIGSLVAFVPIIPQYPTATLDSGWAFALNVAVAKGMVFGRDIIFTFGPYAATYTKEYHPATDFQALWSSALLGVAFACSLICLSRGAGRLGAFALTLFLILAVRDALFFALAFAFLLLVCRSRMAPEQLARIAFTRGVRLTLALLTVALSLTTLVKGTFVAASVTAVVLGLSLLTLRRQPAIAAALGVLFVGALPCLWTIGGQPLAALPAFFAASGALVSGYTNAMSIRGVSWHPILFLSCCLLLGITYGPFIKRGGSAGMILLLGSVVVLFLSLKEGFVRQDRHVLIAAGTLVIMAWMLMLGSPRWGAGIALAIALGSWAIMSHDETGRGPVALASQLRATVGATATALVTRVTTPERLASNYVDSLSAIRAVQPLPELDGSIDIYSYGQSIVLARELNWEPRPILQSYSAYTPRLERINAQHLAGDRAPANILFTVQPIDGRLPALEDGLSWPGLLTGYDISEVRGDIAVLHHRAAPTDAQPVAADPLTSGTFRLGEQIALPAGTPIIWARIDVTLTPLGKVVAFLYKPPYLTIAYRFPDGRAQNYRYISGMGAAGFLAAPLVENTTDFGALELPATAGYFTGRRPKSIVISADSGSGSLWRSTFRVAFFAMHIRPRPISRLLFDRVYAPEAQTDPIPMTSGCTIDLIDRRGDDLPIAIGRYLHIIAWIPPQFASSDVPDAASITLRARNGRITTIAARQIRREDASYYVEMPPTITRAYMATADLAGLSGDYRLGLRVLRGDGGAVECRMHVPVHVSAPRRRPRHRRLSALDE